MNMMQFKKRRLTREEVDDQKFQTAIEGERFRERIEHEANEAIICPHCGSFDWKMQPKCIVNWLGNELLATMVCRKCKRKMPFASQIEPDYSLEDEAGEVDEFELEYLTDIMYRRLGIKGIHPIQREIIKDRIRQRLLKDLT